MYQKIDEKTLLALYEKMVLIRYFEEEVERNVEKGFLHGTTHLYNGQEAVAVGVCSQLEKNDYITSTHRGHGHAIAMGADINKMMAEMFGKITGYSKGKGGSMHIADIEAGNLGSNGVVAGGIPIAVGAALSAQMKQTGGLAVSFFGDGATNEGSFHESLNLASIWDLPVIFLCENNVYGMSSPITEMTNIESLSIRSISYGFPGITIDGNDLFAVIAATKKAIKRARNNEGPTLIEAKTYRFKGHSRSDEELYRRKSEVEKFKERDPIHLFESKLIENTTITRSNLDNIKAKIRIKVKEATEFSINSEEPAIDELFTDLYA